MTDVIEIPIRKARKGDTVWLKPGPHKITAVDPGGKPFLIEAGGEWFAPSHIDRITRRVSEVDALRARIAELEKQLASVTAEAFEWRDRAGAKPDAPIISEGFTPHHGGPCPLDPEALVEIVCKNVPIGTPGFGPCLAKEVAAIGGVIAFKLIAPPHNMPGFGPIKAGPPPRDAEAGAFAGYVEGYGWLVRKNLRGDFWQLATAHAMKDGA
jgi:hypothetical protein